MSLKMSVVDILPTRINGFPLKINQQILFYFVLPTVVTLIIYIANISLDIVVGVKLVTDRKTSGGVVTLVIICIPAVYDYLYQVAYTRKISGLKQQINWNICHFIDFILFPFHIIVCLVQQIYLGLKASNLEDPHREEVLRKLIQNKKEIQVYQFFQAFLQALPQASLQLYLLLDKSSSKYYWTKFFQIWSLFVSLLVATAGVQMYHRYESQRVTISTTGSNPINNPTDGENEQNNRSNDGENAERQEQNKSPEERAAAQELLHQERPPRTPTNERLDTNERLRRTFSDDSQSVKPINYFQSDDDHISRTVLFLAWLFFITHRVFTIVPAFKYCPTVTIIAVLAHYIFLTAVLTIRGDFHKKIHYILVLGYVHLFAVIEVGIKLRRIVAYHILFFVLAIIEGVLLNLCWYNYGKWKAKILYQTFIMNYVLLVLSPVLLIIYFKCLKH